MADGGRMGLRKHTVHGLTEFDVTRIREAMRQHKTKPARRYLSRRLFWPAWAKPSIRTNTCTLTGTGATSWSFCRRGCQYVVRGRSGRQKSIRPHIIRAVNKKDFRALHDEIRAFQNQHASSQESKFIDWFVRLPGFLRRLFLWALFKNPNLLKDYYGTVLVSSIGMFGKGNGWGIPVPNHSLQLTLGGIGEKPGVVNHRVEVREYLSVTISFDHDVIDGAPQRGLSIG